MTGASPPRSGCSRQVRLIGAPDSRAAATREEPTPRRATLESQAGMDAGRQTQTAAPSSMTQFGAASSCGRQLDELAQGTQALKVDASEREGWLTKSSVKGSEMSDWQPRYCVVRGKTLYYVKSLGANQEFNPKNAQGAISLEGAIVQGLDPANVPGLEGDKRFCLSITRGDVPQNMFLFAAPSATDLAAWLGVLSGDKDWAQAKAAAANAGAAKATAAKAAAAKAAAPHAEAHTEARAESVDAHGSSPARSVFWGRTLLLLGMWLVPVLTFGLLFTDVGYGGSVHAGLTSSTAALPSGTIVSLLAAVAGILVLMFIFAFLIGPRRTACYVCSCSS